jgi:hypothetical protein
MIERKFEHNGPGNSDPVKRLQELIGQNVVLLPVWAKSKKPKDSNWTKLTSKDMQSPRHLHQLHYSNIGVLLGKASGGLCSIDIDSNELVGEFLDANPLLKQTLQSKGQRGQNFWIKIKGEYPSTKKIRRNDEAIGEWRADGSQTVIHGIHPCGEPYRILQHVLPIEIAFEEIQWPKGWSIKKTGKPQQQPTLLSAQSTPVATTDQAKRPKPKQPNLIDIGSVKEAIEKTIPEQPKQNNDAIFEFARALKNVEAITGVQLGPEESDQAFAQWCEQNPHLDADKMNEYKDKFILGRVKARLPLFEDPRAYAAEQAKDEVDGSKDPLRLLDRFLFHLQSTTYPEAFFISYADLETYLGQMTQTSWHKKIPLLEYKEVIKTLKTGAFRQGASEYVYLNHPCWTQDEESRAALKRLLASAEDNSKWNMGLIIGTNPNALFTRAA